MSLPGFTAEASLYQAETTYRSAGAGAAAARQSVQAAVMNEVRNSCRDCDGNQFDCPPRTRCVRLCTRTGGYAYCDPYLW